MKCGNERGMVLLLVLVVIALLSALLSDFAFSTLIDLRLAETFRDTTRAEYLARGGITAGRMILQTDRNTYDSRNDPAELWSLGVQDYPVADGAITVQIEDLDGRLPLNQLVDSTGINPVARWRERFVYLCTELALDDPEGLADALIDWMDKGQTGQPDGTTGSGGAEDSYYLSQSPPYEASDKPLKSLDELRLIRGFNAEILAKLAPFVTVHGSGVLNVNTAPPEVLRCWADAAGFTISDVDDLLAVLETGPIKTVDELNDLPNITVLNQDADVGFKSNFYRITSQARVNDGVRRMQAIVEKPNNKLLWQKVY